MRENEFQTKLDGLDVSIYGHEKVKNIDENNDVSAVAVVHWDFYTEMRSWGVKDVSAYATWVNIEFEVNWWGEEEDDDKVEEFSIDTSNSDEWEITTNTDNLEFGNSICPQDVEVDFDTKTITINF